MKRLVDKYLPGIVVLILSPFLLVYVLAVHLIHALTGKGIKEVK